MARYTFTHYRADENCGVYPQVSQSSKTVEFSDDEMDPWTSVLAEFASFLSGVYGYDISEQVFIKTFGSEDPVTLSEARSGY